MKFTSEVTNKFVPHLIGACAAFYFATYLFIRGGYSELPILLTGIVLTILFVTGIYKFEARLKNNDKIFISLLAAFGLWTIFTATFHDADSKFYEMPSRFLITAFIALSILRFGIDIRWIQLGVALSTIFLVYSICVYSDGSRFSPFINATKWGNAIAYQAILAYALSILTTNRWLKSLFLVISITSLYAVLINGTRGAILASIVALLALMIMTLNFKRILITIPIISVLALTAIEVNIVQKRIHAVTFEYNNILKGDYRYSIGQRLNMWYAGVNSSLSGSSLIIGSGYDYTKTLRDFGIKSKKSIKSLDMHHGNFHSMYIDTLARSGLTGLFLLIATLIACSRGRSAQNNILLFSPFAGIALTGLTDSVLELGITATYLLIAGTLLKATSVD